jgi:ClpP class serine protease
MTLTLRLVCDIIKFIALVIRMYEERKKLYKKIETFTNSKVICYVTGDRPNMGIQIAADALDHFTNHLDSIGITERISLVVYSCGGSLLAGWSIVNLIKQFCKEFHAIIPSKALSTATLIALGADSVLMTKQATLGPIDPSVNSHLNPTITVHGNHQIKIPVSVESINGYIEFVKSVGIKSEQDMTKIVLDLASKIHPLVLGDVFRSRSQIRMLGQRLMARHIKDKAKIDKILDFLCSESGSHDYTINRREARDELGLVIQKPNDVQYKIIKALHENYSHELELKIPFNQKLELGADSEKEYSITRGLIESLTGGSTKFVSKGKLKITSMQVAPNITQDIVEDNRIFEGWTNE